MRLSIPLSLICIVVLILFLKFVIRPELRDLKNVNVEMFNQTKFSPLNLKQKVLGVSLIVLILLLLLPGILPSDLAIRTFLNDNKLKFFYLSLY